MSKTEYKWKVLEAEAKAKAVSGRKESLMANAPLGSEKA